MKSSELYEALSIAKQGNETYRNNDLGVFDGYGLPGFKAVYVTRSQVAALIRWQAFRFDGSIDSEQLNEIARIGRYKFRIIDEKPASSPPPAGEASSSEDPASESNSPADRLEGDFEPPKDPVKAAVERARKLFDELSLEIYYGFNFRCVLRDLPDETLKTLEAIIERAKLERENPSARGKMFGRKKI